MNCIWVRAGLYQGIPSHAGEEEKGLFITQKIFALFFLLVVSVTTVQKNLNA